jgi:23S rRNA (pseudouridine1915-N3)-methyltransferase
VTLEGQSNLAFVIGGAFGLSDELRGKADICISFSRMTFTHQMVKLLLIEQIYRAFKINRGEKYHW